MPMSSQSAYNKYTMSEKYTSCVEQGHYAIKNLKTLVDRKKYQQFREEKQTALLFKLHLSYQEKNSNCIQL